MRHLLALLLLALFSGCGGKGGSSGSGPSAPSITVLNNRALLSWTAGSGLTDGYLVDESTDNATWTNIQNVTETSTYVDGLTSGTKYYFRVRAYNSAGNSAASSSAFVTL